MEKSQKEQVVAELKELMTAASSCVAMDFGGVPMSTFVPFRKECATSNARLVVVKNTLARIALKDTEYEVMDSMLAGMTALLFTMDNDQVVGAKLVKKYADLDEHITVKGGAIDGTLLDVAGVMQLSELPSKEELQSKLLATMLAVPQNFVRLLNAVPQNFVQLLGAYRDKVEQQ
ncbi:50S ribosomal protein L10 [bacterium]|nr:50S ribosomal protein L10 [bacterium]